MKAMMKKAFKSARFIIIFGTLNKILTFIKEALIASKIGCCFETDAYFTAFVAATLLAEIIGEGISTGMVPILLKIEEKEGSWRKVDYVNNLLHIIIILSMVLIILGWFLSPLVIKILATGFAGEEFQTTVNLMKIGLPIVIFITIRAVFIAYLQSFHAFKAGTKSWVYYNIVYLVFLIFLNRYGIYGLMIAGVLASAVQLYSVITPSMNLGYRYERILDLKNAYIQEFGIMFIPIIIGISINRVNIVVDKSIASTLAPGSISWLNYANDIIQLILGIFITAIVTVLFPIISQEFSRENIETLKSAMLRGTKIVLSIVIPAMVILVTLSEPIVRLLFERGEFGTTATLMTSGALTYYALGLGSMAMVLILTKVHYAMHDSLTPMISAGVGVITNFVLNLILSKYMGINGIALATSISTTLVTILLIKDLNKRVKVIDIHREGKRLIKLIVSAAIMAWVVIITFNILGKISLDNIIGDIMKVLIPIGTGIITYLSIGKLTLKEN
ncbi:murein biosynthesis integral membrane protein MurJ [Clostridium sp. Cult2]|uniref:murein biosynthesis integral membrane protein MurJ n=1 Tax=Clostridium sp. Cult2 TaxID=2079003 RepID=UPI001F00B54E|nr:murein biosynthesis integral membrane protein MurJ [Clostridium sp. Cult2]MCF6466194.1 murein biosynthesis integral membrane protein MurJ [Clostridium sp. Cult2]